MSNNILGNAGVGNAVINLFGRTANGPIFLTTTASASGSYAFGSLPTGVYIIQAVAAGYRIQSRQAVISTDNPQDQGGINLIALALPS